MFRFILTMYIVKGLTYSPHGAWAVEMSATQSLKVWLSSDSRDPAFLILDLLFQLKHFNLQPFILCDLASSIPFCDYRLEETVILC